MTSDFDKKQRVADCSSLRRGANARNQPYVDTLYVLPLLNIPFQRPKLKNRMKRPRKQPERVRTQR